MLVQDKKVTKSEILEICRKREKENSIDFEEVYYDILNHKTTI